MLKLSSEREGEKSLVLKVYREREGVREGERSPWCLIYPERETERGRKVPGA